MQRGSALKGGGEKGSKIDVNTSVQLLTADVPASTACAATTPQALLNAIRDSFADRGIREYYIRRR